MRAGSVATRQLDPYRAGLELGEGLRALAPEVVFTFSSIHYDGSPELLEGLHDGVDCSPVVVGATGDGFYEASLAAAIGASALGLNSGGRARWHAVSARGVTDDVEGALERCIASLVADAGGEEPVLGVLFADFRSDAAKLVEVLGRRLAAPVVGGLAGDEYRMERCHVYAGREALTDGLVLLGATGSLDFTIHVAGDLVPVGRPGVVSAAAGTCVQGIDGLGALGFIARQAGKPLSPADLGIGAFRVASSDDADQTCLRTIRRTDPEDGSVTLFGAVQPGQSIQFCQASPEVIVRDVREISARLGVAAERPAAGLVISCAGRKHVLGDRDVDREVTAVREGFGRPFPLAGFPSFGEIAPRRTASGYTRTLFHNMTYILVVFET
jgi:hypothetical protein